jgi:hypothetical protein
VVSEYAIRRVPFFFALLAAESKESLSRIINLMEVIEITYFATV